MNLLCGTSGFSYKEWKGPFYPEKHADNEMLSYYAERLSAVEINDTFYRMPKENILQAWADKVPDNFRFSIKAPRKVTHFKRLKETTEECESLFKTIHSLGSKFGCILFQLPANFQKDVKRLQTFLDLIPADINAAFEFRHQTWLDYDTYQILKSKNCALVLTETDEAPETKFIETADWAYLRLRRTQYSEQELKDRMEKIKNSRWNNVFVFFKHEDEGTGPRFAKQFMALI